MAKSTPLQVSVPGVHCDACIASITEAVHTVDADASVAVDLATKRVIIGGEGEAHEFIKAIEDAGYEVKAAE